MSENKTLQEQIQTEEEFGEDLERLGKAFKNEQQLDQQNTETQNINLTTEQLEEELGDALEKNIALSPYAMINSISYINKDSGELDVNFRDGTEDYDSKQNLDQYIRELEYDAESFYTNQNDGNHKLLQEYIGRQDSEIQSLSNDNKNLESIESDDIISHFPKSLQDAFKKYNDKENTESESSKKIELFGKIESYLNPGYQTNYETKRDLVSKTQQIFGIHFVERGEIDYDKQPINNDGLKELAKVLIEYNKGKIQKIQRNSIYELSKSVNEQFYDNTTKLSQDGIISINNLLAKQRQYEEEYNAQDKKSEPRLDEIQKERNKLNTRKGFTLVRIFAGGNIDEKLKKLDEEEEQIRTLNQKATDNRDEAVNKLLESRPDYEYTLYNKLNTLHKYGKDISLNNDIFVGKPYSEVNSFLNYFMAEQYIKNNKKFLKKYENILTKEQKEKVEKSVQTLEKQQEQMAKQPLVVEYTKSIQQQQTVQNTKAQQQAEQNKTATVEQTAEANKQQNKQNPTKQTNVDLQQQKDKKNKYGLALKDIGAQNKKNTIIKKEVPAYKPDKDFKLIDTYFSATINNKEVPFSGFVLTLMSDKNLKKEQKRDLINTMLKNVDDELKNKVLTEEERKQINQARKNIETYLNNSLSLNIFKKNDIETKCLNDVKCENINTIKEISELVKDNKKLYNSFDKQIKEVYRQQKQEEQKTMEKLFVDFQGNAFIPNCGSMFLYNVDSKQYKLADNYEEEKKKTEQALFNALSPECHRILTNKMNTEKKEFFTALNEIKNDLSNKYVDTFKQDRQNPLTVSQVCDKIVKLNKEIDTLSDKDPEKKKTKVQQKIEVKEQELEAMSALCNAKLIDSIKTIRTFDNNIKASGMLEEYNKTQEKQITAQGKENSQGHTRENSTQQVLEEEQGRQSLQNVTGKINEDKKAEQQKAEQNRQEQKQKEAKKQNNKKQQHTHNKSASMRDKIM